MSRLLVAVIGNRQSGKSTTWNELFGQTVKTGKYPRELAIGSGQCLTVFLVSGSAEERGKDIEDILLKQTPEIVLCSVQYAAGADETLQYFVDHDYFMMVHWLNPGYNDSGHQPDSFGIIEWLRHKSSLIGIRSGQVATTHRVEELRMFLRGWAHQKGLIHQCP
jgi:hypothetical protein